MVLARVWEPGQTDADSDGVGRPWLVARAEGWDLLYAGLSKGTWRVCRAATTETEPRALAPAGPPLEPGPSGSGEEGGVTSPCALPTDDGGLLVVYAGIDGEGRRALFSAWAPTVKPDEGILPALAWQRLGPTLSVGQPGDADAAGCDHPSLVRMGGERWLWYTAHDGLGRGGRIAAASSTPGSPWRRHGVVLGHGAPGAPDADGAEAPGAVVGPTGLVDLVYTGRSGEGPRVMRARSSDGVSFDRLGPATRAGASEASLAIGHDGRPWITAVLEGGISVWPSLT